MQYVETHNSYHLVPDTELLTWPRRGGYADGEWSRLRLGRAIDYSNLPLTAQLDRGIRAFEFDVHDDPAGNRFVLRAAGITPRQRRLPVRDRRMVAYPSRSRPLLLIEAKRDRRSGCAGLCADRWRWLEDELVQGLGRERIVAPAGIGPM